ncbi:hypothetical protein [Rhodoferax ferrireducens]|uniref:hypothetical protein n=1 Tax=Rhodoferax ferrireducens TaxID=192843 RepID=UPI000E0D3196|nr:hypothetical protein [Rhodoferax ferrireducens]
MAQPPDIEAHPTRGQSLAQQHKDNDECSRWAMRTVGHAVGETHQSIYMQTLAACMAGRGYAVK